MRIFAGRPDTPKFKKHIPTYEEMAAKAQEQKEKPKVQQFTKDKITFSQEGLQRAGELRNCLNEYGLNTSIDIVGDMEELDKQLRTKNMDYTNGFWQEMGEVIKEERAAWGAEAGESSFDNSITSWAKAYQVVRDRIVEEFSDSDREITYVMDKVTGQRREETMEDRLAELDYAYDQRVTFIAASKKVMAQIQETFGGKQLPEKPEDIEKKTKEAYMQAISDKNMNRLRQKVSSFQDYRPVLSIGSHWEQVLSQLW